MDHIIDVEDARGVRDQLLKFAAICALPAVSQCYHEWAAELSGAIAAVDARAVSA